jgi:hypothetical protein
MRNARRASSPSPRSFSSPADLRSSLRTVSVLELTSSSAGSTFRRTSRTIRTDPSSFQDGDIIAVDRRSVGQAPDTTASSGVVILSLQRPRGRSFGPAPSEDAHVRPCSTRVGLGVAGPEGAADAGDGGVRKRSLLDRIAIETGQSGQPPGQGGATLASCCSWRMEASMWLRSTPNRPIPILAGRPGRGVCVWSREPRRNGSIRP